MSIWLQILLGWAFMVLIMMSLWEVQRRYGDAGIVDVAWGLGVGLLSIFFCIQGTGPSGRRILIGCLAVTWAARLSFHIARRLKQLPEDGRYQALKETWGQNSQRNLFWFYQLQAFWSVLFALPMLLGANNPAAFWSVADIFGSVIWGSAIAGEAVADWQLSQFRANPANRKQVCRTGLWRYSRHPNYFFEWVHWWAYVCFAWGSDFWIWSLAGPLCMLFFLLKVTGVPPTEAQALKSRGDAYRDYQRTTSVFFPWPPASGVQS